ncbi:MAG: energy-coupling factor transporter transmembrane component T family protein [Arthrobacter sp.]|uniref:energy-coupling factor transporter transmembrane component T family protein n=1 Tax=Arthrobacter sp. AOP36-A1-22 TaxID=3457684 RepID=UPI00265673D7|nr:energy-coupling factor transporter transmembrane protein EcfT [Micrococcaceae bacterium]MDN5824780.1 energy-coupling factor transporter transmembrane protein EcfT [Micrococcaceae bacterium]MDN5878960.1 energy-coupling factor transporter transmembrane protein EcfT [Micrococcaceae bacterium]MDN5887095.1 energy-coupling factor transporter transmembrane protein EcfT [Micrococcaceae bacterium]MDN5904552.1 energy-coupling factor transporter transmembrane protein EcfT [Micrococcaceae bacterium]
MSAGPLPWVNTATPLGRRNPTMKLAVLFVVSFALLFVFDPLTPALLYPLALAAVLIWGRPSPRMLLLAHIPFLGFALGMLMINAITRPGEELFTVLGLQASVEGVTLGASLALRTFVLGVLSIGFVFSTDAVALTDSLHQQARLGPRLCHAILAGYQMLQDMPGTWQTIRQAQSVRAPAPAPGVRRPGIREFGHAAFSLLVVSLRRGERMAQSMESRGLGLAPRTVWKPIRVERTDWIMAFGVLTVLVVVLGLGVTGGWIRGYSALWG